jgi:ribonucleoside-triphosphate reductase
MDVRKRDGRIVEFDQSKIINAILAAFKEVDGEISEYAETKAKNIAEYIQKQAESADHVLGIEEIQDYVEKGIMATKRKDVARKYITYRNERTAERNRNSNFMKTISEKLTASNVQNQNANVDEHSFGGRMGEASDALAKQYALDYCVSDMAKVNHINNEIYIHDLGSYAVGSHNCLSIPFDKLLANGFNTRQTDVRPANSVNTAFQLVAVIFQLQSLQQFGGVSATHLDWTMVPYVRKSFRKHWLDGLKYLYQDDKNEKNNSLYWICKEGKLEGFDDELCIEANFFHLREDAFDYAMDMTIKEVYQAVEGMYHNLNTLQSRSGNQLPFTSINYGTCTLPEGRMVTKALLDVSREGIGKLHRTSIFPCGIFQYMKGVNDKPGTPNYDLYRLALQSTSERLYPNYANVDWSGNKGYDPNDPCTYFSTMGCRTANGWDINGMGQRKDGRGNICPVTIIMPTLAMEAIDLGYKHRHKYPNNMFIDDVNIEEFIKLLDKKIHEAKDMLLERFEWICSQSPESAKFMYENGTMEGYIPKEGIRSALKHGTLAIGQIGLAETLQILIGIDHTTEKGMALAKRIEQLFKDRCTEFKEEYKLNFGVYYTPAENLCYTAMKKFKEKYGKIHNVSDKDYFTNSIHVPVWKKISPFEKIDIESQLTGYSSAGCITYVELEGGVRKNIDALETIVNYAMDHDIPYFAVNVPNDTCLDCGYTGEFNDSCPICGSKNIQQLRRVTGYLTGNYKTAFNKGKQQEVEMRTKHTGIMEQ